MIVDDRIDAAACAVEHGDCIQVLHIAISDEGLLNQSSYALMGNLISYSESLGRKLYMGGMPGNARPSLLVFKRRWANSFERVFLLRIINQPTAYASLCKLHGASSSFFPAYRNDPVSRMK